jgi:coenzyme F420-reducing hydrogenase delta subunit/ferredoxin
MFEPKIIGFLCTWCSYTGADTAGIARLKVPANLRVVRVPCSGRVSPELIMRAFAEGADGVLVLGCHIGECHYETGNHRTAKRLPVLERLLSFAGLEPERLRLDWVSASEGERFARIVGEFTATVRALGPAQWRLSSERYSVVSDQLAVIGDQLSVISDHVLVTKEHSFPGVSRTSEETDGSSPGHYSLISNHYSPAIQSKARELLETGQVSCVIGYELGPRGRARPAFIYDPQETRRLVWNPDCTHNLVRYLPEKLNSARSAASSQRADKEPVAIVVKPCDSRAINVLLAENQFNRKQVFVIGVVCDGVVESARQRSDRPSDLARRCLDCMERTPRLYDFLVGEPLVGQIANLPYSNEAIDRLQALAAPERMAFWLDQFDRCIRCYACRQACPACNCPTCLYERDDSLWVGMGIGLDEKRTFHLGRAYHLAGRCVGCDECERACPVNIPIGLLNRMLAREMQAAFGYRAGDAPVPAPLATILGGAEEA